MITVQTLTRNLWPAWLDECRASVAAALPTGGRHEVVPCLPSEYADLRTAMPPTEYLAWVDDDDRVVPGAIHACINALRRSGAALAFTHEARIDASGARVGGVDTRPRTLRDIAMHPRMSHHLTVMRPRLIAPEVLRHAQRIGLGIDWLIRAYLALNHGVVQVPVVGYEWRQHGEQDSARTADQYAAAMPALREVTNGWLKYDAPIHQFIPR